MGGGEPGSWFPSGDEEPQGNMLKSGSGWIMLGGEEGNQSVVRAEGEALEVQSSSASTSIQYSYSAVPRAFSGIHHNAVKQEWLKFHLGVVL